MAVNECFFSTVNCSRKNSINLSLFFSVVSKVVLSTVVYCLYGTVSSIVFSTNWFLNYNAPEYTAH
jgi:hypothetical protein